MKPPTPRDRGFRMPAEWEPQRAIWLAWPHNPITWPADILPGVEAAYTAVVRELAPGQAVRLLVNDDAAEAAAVRTLRQGGADPDRVEFLRIRTADTWIRDYGPTFVVQADSGRVGMVKWTFNAWGGKYGDLLADDGVPFAMNERLGLPLFEAGVVLEGGSIEVNGSGTVLTTEQCLLNPNRNPHLGRPEIEQLLRDHLDVTNVVWLGEGIAGDDTDGHIDDIARFVDARTILCAVEEDPADPNHALLADNLRRLSLARDEQGREFTVLPLPMPGPVEDGGDRFPASYANFYIGNRAVVVPVFGDPNDARALALIGACFPGRRVVGVDCRLMVQGLGAIHCCSQQEPAGA